MQSSWDEEGRCVVHASGAVTYVPYLATADQVRRWVAAGFDLQAAAERADAFVARFRTAGDFDIADDLLSRHVEAEGLTALEQGVPADDPDLYRIAISVRAYEFAPA